MFSMEIQFTWMKLARNKLVISGGDAPRLTCYRPVVHLLFSWSSVVADAVL